MNIVCNQTVGDLHYVYMVLVDDGLIIRRISRKHNALTGLRRRWRPIRNAVYKGSLVSAIEDSLIYFERGNINPLSMFNDTERDLLVVDHQMQWFKPLPVIKEFS